MDRGRLNVVFYRNYAGLPAAEIKSQAVDCSNVIMPRRFVEAGACIEEHRAGRAIVLVGSLDFIIEPLATEIGAAACSPRIWTSRDGRFTGELTGPPVEPKKEPSHA